MPRRATAAPTLEAPHAEQTPYRCWLQSGGFLRACLACCGGLGPHTCGRSTADGPEDRNSSVERAVTEETAAPLLTDPVRCAAAHAALCLALDDPDADAWELAEEEQAPMPAYEGILPPLDLGEAME